MPFQPQTVTLAGTISPVVIVESAGQQAPTNIIDRTKPYIVRVTVSLTGSLVPFLAGQHFITVARVESIGGGFEGNIGSPISTVITPVGSSWTATIDIVCPPAGPAGIDEGVYELVVLLRTFNVAGTPLGLTGYQSLEYIEFYNAP